MKQLSEPFKVADVNIENKKICFFVDGCKPIKICADYRKTMKIVEKTRKNKSGDYILKFPNFYDMRFKLKKDQFENMRAYHEKYD